MNKTSKILTILALAVAPAACAHGPSSNLVDARKQYAQASDGPARDFAPVQLYEAEKALQMAERAHDEDPGSERERDLAYIAVRRVQVAETKAAMRQAQQAQQLAEAARVATLEQQRDRTMKRLQKAESQLSQREQTLQTREQALQQAQRERDQFQRRLSAATASLQGMATIDEKDPERTVVVLNNQVLFEHGKAELIDPAKGRLRQLAQALKEQGDQGRQIVIEGYTDSTGTAAVNQRLSQQRAEAVRQFLVLEGVPPHVVSAIGFGAQDPVATNATPEGRANNRRVEIVIENPQVGQGQGTQGQGAPIVGRGESRR